MICTFLFPLRCRHTLEFDFQFVSLFFLRDRRVIFNDSFVYVSSILRFQSFAFRMLSWNCRRRRRHRCCRWWRKKKTREKNRRPTSASRHKQRHYEWVITCRWFRCDRSYSLLFPHFDRLIASLVQTGRSLCRSRAHFTPNKARTFCFFFYYFIFMLFGFVSLSVRIRNCSKNIWNAFVCLSNACRSLQPFIVIIALFACFSIRLCLRVRVAATATKQELNSRQFESSSRVVDGIGVHVLRCSLSFPLHSPIERSSFRSLLSFIGHSTTSNQREKKKKHEFRLCLHNDDDLFVAESALSKVTE